MSSKLNVVHPNAVIGKEVIIDPFAIIEEDVVIGANTWIGPHACIMNGSRIGSHCKIFPGAIIGSIPQDKKFLGETSYLKIGDYVHVREYCTLNRGTIANGETIIGDHALLMAYTHVAHDCVIGEHAILSNNVNLAGHVKIEPYAILGGLVAVHQYVRIGAHSMVGGGSLVRKDVPPYVKAAREPLSYIGVNVVGLQRRGFEEDTIEAIHELYRQLFVRKNSMVESLKIIRDKGQDILEIKKIIEFIQQSERGLMRGFKSVS